MKPVWLCGLSAIALTITGCASLQGPPPPPRVTLTSSFQAGLTALDAGAGAPPTCDDNLLTCGIVRVAQRSETFRNRYMRLTGQVDAASHTEAASAIALLGFEVFDAHEDNVRAAALLLGVSNVFSSRMNAGERAAILYDATRSMNCFADKGQQVWTATQTGGDGELLAGAIVSVRSASDALQIRLATLRLAQAQHQARIGAAREGSAERALAEADLARGRLEISTIETRLGRVDEELPAAEASLAAINRFPSAFQTSWQAADGVIHSRLAAQMPNIAEISDAIRSLQTRTDGTTPANEDVMDDGAAALDSSRSTADLLSDLSTALNGASMARRSGRYDEMLAGLETCSAMATG